jgi:hypothetical protein
MVPILDEGVSSLSFCLEGVEQVVPHEYIRELLDFQKGAPKQVDVHGGTLEGFLEYDHGRSSLAKKYYLEPHHPSVSLMDVQKDFGENERKKGNRHRVELDLLGFDCQVANKPLSPHDQPVVL